MPASRPSLRLRWTGLVILVVAGVAGFLVLHRGADLAVTATARILTGRERIAKIQEKIEEVKKKETTKAYRREGFDPDKAEKATVRGTVRTEDEGGDLSSLVIDAESAVPHNTLFTGFRAKGGRFDGRIRPGVLHLIAKGVDGYVPAFCGPYELEPGEKLEGLDIVLRKGRNAAIRVLGRDGRFTLDSLRSGSRYLLAVDAEGFAPKVLLGIGAGEKDIVVEMPPETVVMGTLTGPLDSLRRHRDGTPYVGYSFPLRTGMSSFWQSGESSVEIRDGKGHFIITHVSPGELSILAGHATRRIEVEGIVPDLTIDMNVPEVGLGAMGEITTRTVVFRLNTPDGEMPTTGVLSVTHKEMRHGQRFNITTPAPIRDGQARVVVSTPNRVGYRPEGMVVYWVPEKYAVFEVLPGSSPHVAGLTVYPAGAIVGTVAEADGSPARGSMISVRVVRKPPRPDRRSVDIRVKDGSISDVRTSQFAEQPLPLGGSYQIYMRRGGTCAVSEPVELTAARPVREVALRYGETSSFLVRVTDADGNPLRGIKLAASWMMAGCSYGFGDKTTGADGTVRFEGLSVGVPGQYRIGTFGNAGYQSQRVETDPTDDEVAIRLEKGAVIEGVVIGEKTGKPLPDVRVFAWPYRQREGLTSSEDMTTGQDGRFRLTTLKPGLEHTLNAYALSGSVVANVVATAGSGETVTIRISGK